MCVVLVGNKSDLTETRVIPHDEAAALAASLCIQYFECSSKTDSDFTVEKIMCQLTMKIKKDCVDTNIVAAKRTPAKTTAAVTDTKKSYCAVS